MIPHFRSYLSVFLFCSLHLHDLSTSAFSPSPHQFQRTSTSKQTPYTMSIKSTKNADPVNDVSKTKRFRYEASTDIQSVYNQMDIVDKKIPMKNGPLAFLATLFLGVPIWFTFLLPFTIVASAIHFGYVLFSEGKIFSNSKKSGKTTIDSVFDACEDENIEIVPMESRKYDIVLLGATGYTGKLATTYLAKQYGGEHLWITRPSC